MKKFHKLINYAIVTIVVGFVVAAFFLGIFDGNTEPGMSKAVAYDIISQSEFESVDRSRREVWIDIAIPTYRQNTPEEYAQTAIKAAWDLREKFKKELPNHPAKMFAVQVKQSESVVIAKAIFAIDKKGWDGKMDCEWAVSTLSSKLPPVEYFQTDNIWWDMRDDYQIPDPAMKGETMTDEKSLRLAIAEKIHIPFEMAHLPVITMSDYLRK